MSPSLYSASHTSTILNETPQDQDINPEAFEEELNRDRKEDPYLVRFDEGDPANPKVGASCFDSRILS